MDEKSCGAVVFHGDGRDRKYLLLHYESGHWDYVKGHVEKDESESATTIREAKEETGLNIEILPGFRHGIRYFFRVKGKLIHKEVIFFVAESKENTVKLSHEHVDYKWLPFDEALNKLTFKNAKETLKKADSFLKGRLV